MEHRLTEKWIKASIAGTIWAASEIVLGSFLHNLKIPFSGNILTAIGLIILISISYIWSERGLFWRAGLICALMKTMSPSAVIFGPMIAICAEAFLLEFSVQIFGRTFAGYLTGAVLAMSWNLFQKIANYIIYYGANIIEVYKNLLNLAREQLNIQSDIVWLPVFILLIIFASFGMFAGLIGMIVGRKMLKEPVSDSIGIQNRPLNKDPDKSGTGFIYSTGWLFINIALIIGSFILVSNTSWIIWSTTLTVIIIIWSFRYKRALRQLSKPKFWILFVLITLITALAFTKAQNGESSWQEGLITGIQMNYRAAVIIVGFSVLGTELFNPSVRKFFIKTPFKNLPLALELSVESLPSFIASIPDFKSLVRNPVSIFHRVISQADSRLSEIKNKNISTRRIFIVTGSAGQGKTTYLKKLIDIFRKNMIIAGGIISERVMTGSHTTGYDIVNIETGEKEVFLRENGESGSERVGRFKIYPKGLAMGQSILSSLLSAGKEIIIIDEVGLLELRNKGWSECIDKLLDKSENHILITVRDTYIDAVKNRWNLAEAVILNIKEKDHLQAGTEIISLIS
jgi:nucleoside-triphosphatase THEP1